MNKKQIIDFVNKNQVCTLATCDGDKPHTRGMMTYRADSKGIIFHTGESKDIYKQLQKNSNVELCFNHDNIQIRISGKAVLENDVKLKDEIIKSRPFLNSIIVKNGYESIKVFRINEMVATVWTMTTNLAPKEFVKLSDN